MNTPVSFEISKELKEKGFDGYCDKKYIAQCLWQSPNNREKYKNSEIHKNSSDVAAPTIAEVVMWLYQNHGIWISVEKNSFIGGSESSFISNVGRKKEYKSPTEAYSQAIEFTLKNLI